MHNQPHVKGDDMHKLAGLLIGFSLIGVASADAPARWPGGHKAAIALTYDDALKSQLDIAIPQLDAAGLKGTFFLMGRQMGDEVPRWHAAAAAGHELGNHTINHPCAKGSYDMPAQYTSEAYDVDVLLAEIGVMNGFLQALDGKTLHAFATPCGQHVVGGRDYLRPLQQAHLSSYIRDYLAMPSPTVSYAGFVGTSGADMIKWVADITRKGGAGVIVFHGVGGDYLNVSTDAHKQLVQYLKDHQQDIWTATFSEVMSRAVAIAKTQK
jgi:peptidoglycan/xylan/chitin deacetylase (PgdA/CDA1 family)